MIFQTLVAHCQPVQLRNNPSGLVIESPGILPNKFFFKTDTTTETTISIKSRTASERPPVIIGQELSTYHGCNQSVITQTKPYFGFFGPLTSESPSPCSSSSIETATETMKTTTETTTETNTETTTEIATVTPSVTYTESTTSPLSTPSEINVLSYTFTSVFASPPCHAIIDGACSKISCGEEVTQDTTLPACLWHTLSSQPEIIQNQTSVAAVATHLQISPQNETNEEFNLTLNSSQIAPDERININGSENIMFHRYAICVLIFMLF